MPLIDLELKRLKKLEAFAFERYMRLWSSGAMPQHPRTHPSRERPLAGIGGECPRVRERGRGCSS
jgi:hypothetical protein